MPRKPSIWWYKTHKCFYTTIDGKKVRLDPDRTTAEKMFYRLKSEDRTVSHEAVEGILDAFLEWTEEHRPDSFRWYRDYVTSFWKSLPSGIRVSEIKPYHVEEWASKGGGKRGKITAIKRAFRWAEEMGYVERSPVAYLRKPEPKSREQIISEEEYRAILAATDEPFSRLCTFCWLTGCRPQEATNAHSRHLDHDNRRLVFPKHEAKGKRKPRIIYLPDEAYQLVHEEQGYLLTNSRGGKWVSSAVKCRFDRLEKKLGTHYTLYAFRHTYAHRMLKVGVDPITLAVLMGHSKPSMLADVYSNMTHDPKHLLSVSGILADGKQASVPASPPDTH